VDFWLLFGWGVIIFLSCLVGIFAWLVWPITIGAMYKPTEFEVARRMLALADVGPEDLVYDLGSGDGRIIIMAAQEFGAKAVGIEADPIRLYTSKCTIQSHGLSQGVKVIRGNFFNQNLEAATVITVYQSQRINQKLKSKFFEELQLGTRIVTNRYTFDEWQPSKLDKDFKIYLYHLGESL
jgi:precorrin-6B methylase 2